MGMCIINLILGQSRLSNSRIKFKNFNGEASVKCIFFGTHNSGCMFPDFLLHILLKVPFRVNIIEVNCARATISIWLRIPFTVFLFLDLSTGAQHLQ